MRARILRFTCVVGVLLLSVIARPVQAQPPRSGGFDLMYGLGSAVGGDYRDRSGTLNSFELFFSTRMDGGNTPLLLGAAAWYFAADDPQGVCATAPYVLGCGIPFPDMAAGGLVVAFEPNLLPNLFVHVNGGMAVVQPSSSGGPTIGFLGGAKLGHSIGRHLAILVGGRILTVPDMRGQPGTVPAVSFGLRVR